jgi:hypothetical protein
MRTLARWAFTAVGITAWISSIDANRKAVRERDNARQLRAEAIRRNTKAIQLATEANEQMDRARALMEEMTGG